MIKIDNLFKKFEHTMALEDLTTEIPKGSIFGLVGSNGSGKSTLLRMIAGIYKPWSGTITINGEEVYENPLSKVDMFYISDDQYTDRTSTIRQMAKRYKLFYPNYDVDEALEMAKIFELDPDRKFKTFSKGMVRQSHIILGLAAHTKVLLCDETFDGLDPVKRKMVKKLLANAVLEREATVIIASHNLRELEDICDHIALIHRGKLVLQRSIDDLESGIYKVQTAFDRVMREEDFTHLAPMSFEQRGRMIALIARGAYEDIEHKLQAMQPLYYELLPLSLDEIFIAEMEVLGYDTKDLII